MFLDGHYTSPFAAAGFNGLHKLTATFPSVEWERPASMGVENALHKSHHFSFSDSHWTLLRDRCIRSHQAWSG